MEKYLPILAVVIDGLVGDPRIKWHPVVLIGNLIAFLESLLLNPAHSGSQKQWRGFILVLLVLSLTYGLIWSVLQALSALHPLAAFTGGALLLSFTISPRSLAEAGQEIKQYLLQENLELARQKVGWIVGRDTHRLDSSEITRATVETIAENIVDGIIAPLFYFAIGGVALACLYRAVNTLDSMVGYKNVRYSDFGKVAARTDDLFNYIPARITALLILAASFLLGHDAGGVVRSVRRDARKHPSPNSGYAEAAVAGALGIRLGGTNYYGGIQSFRAYMGDARKCLEPVHIEQTITIMFLTTALFIAAITLLRY